jgi:enterochelin esterase-like enzyme
MPPASGATTAPDAATAAPPPGVPRPGGPLRVRSPAAPPLPGVCTETAGHVDQRTFLSNVLAVSQPVQRYLVYTPACYRYTTTRYPVVYLLHGAQTDETQWQSVGVFLQADRLIASHTIAPTVIVLPDGIWGMGSYGASPTPFDQFLLGEVLPAVEQDYRVLGDAAHRALGGISRGGEWALIEGGLHPELFGKVGGNSPAVGPPGSPNAYLVSLYQRAPAAQSGTQQLWLDVGQQDSLVGPVTSLHEAFDAAGIEHQFHVQPGSHDRAYWASQTAAYLRFYTAGWS